jgi:hypothetical protein
VRVVLGIALVAVALGGCGNARTAPPDVTTPEAPKGTRVVALKPSGVRFTAPVNWRDLPALGRRAGGIQSRTATVAIWAYRRTEPLPADRAALEEVQGLLLERVRRRDPSFRLDRSTVGRRAGAHAIELVGRQTIAGLPFGVRSAHLFSNGTEYVVDAYAPPQRFEALDATVFQPLLRSLELTRRAP